jgi:hypothetical protein
LVPVAAVNHRLSQRIERAPGTDPRGEGKQFGESDEPVSGVVG